MRTQELEYFEQLSRKRQSLSIDEIDVWYELKKRVDAHKYKLKIKIK